MSDRERLLSSFDSGEFIRPPVATPSLVDLSRAMATLCDAPDIDQSDATRTVAAQIGPSDHLVLVLADGLGMNFIETLPDSSFLARNLQMELHTVFPSTTAVALTTLATGEWPSHHAVTGWWTHLPQISAAATILPFVTRSDGKSLSDRGMSIEAAFPTPSLFPVMRRDTLCLLPEKLVESHYSRYFSGGTPRSGYKTLPEAIDMIAGRVRAAAHPTFTYFYTLDLDAVAHQYGSTRPEVRAALLELDRELERLAAMVGDRARVVVSADHGFLDAPLEVRRQINATHDVMATLRHPPSGDARVIYFHVEPGQDEQFRDRVAKRLGSAFMILSREEVQCLNLFGPGPMSDETAARIGDYVGISTGMEIVEYRPRPGEGQLTSLPSHHSGLSSAEMRIPLIVR